jgi:anthranilate phosphoribosyltransferase
MKGECVPEITGAAKVMREKALKVDAGPGPVVDVVGTGGDASGTFNISTTAAFVTAGAGVTVAKHGNRAVSSKSGAADVLKALGVNIEAEISRVEEALQTIGIGFLFAPMMHAAMKYAIGPRREMGVRTIFNILGPLTNPAGATSQLTGVYADALTEPLAQVLNNLGSTRAFVVHGSDGLDEVTITGATSVAQLKEGAVTSYTVTPEMYGMPIHSPGSIKGGDGEKNAHITRDVLKGTKGAHRDIVILNAAFALTAAGVADAVESAVHLAEESIDSGAAAEKLARLVELCR